MRKRVLVAILFTIVAFAPTVAFGATSGPSCPDWTDITYDGTGLKAVPYWSGTGLFADPPNNFPSSGDDFEQRDLSGLQMSKDQNIIWSVGDRANDNPTNATGAADGMAANWRIYAHDAADGSLEGMYDIDRSVLLVVDNLDANGDPGSDGSAEFPDTEELAIDYRSGTDRLYVLDIGDDAKNRGKPNTINATNYPVVYRFNEPTVTFGAPIDTDTLNASADSLKRYDLKYYDDTDDATANQIWINGESGFFDAMDLDGSGPNHNLFVLTRVGENLGVGSDGNSDDHRVLRIATWNEYDPVNGDDFTRVEQVAEVDIPATDYVPAGQSHLSVFGADMKTNNREWVVRNGERAFVWTRYKKDDNTTWYSTGAVMNQHPLAEELPTASDQSCSSTKDEFDYIKSNNNEEAIAFHYPSGGSADGFLGTQDSTTGPQLFATDDPTVP